MSRTSTGPRTPISRHLRTALALVAVCGGVTAWSGCAGESDDQAAVRVARQKLLAINSGASPASPGLRREVYQDIQNRLRPVAQGLDGTAAAAALTLLGEAETGLAEIAAADGATRDNELLSLVAQARSAASLFHSQSSLASAMESYDPARTLEDLRESGRDFQTDLAAVQASRDVLQQRLDELTAAAAAKAGQARERRLEAARIRAASMEADPASRAAAAEQAFRVSREADSLDKEAAELNASAGVVRPQIATADIDIQRWTRQIELSNLARTNLQSAVDARLGHAGAARRAADEAAARFDAIVLQIEALRTGDSATAYDSAASAYTAGVATLRRAAQSVAKPETKAPLAVSAAQAQSSLADVHRSRARVLAVVGELYEAAGASSPALPRSAEYRAMAQEVFTKADELLAKASEGYANAQSALASAGLRGDLRERADRLGAMLTEASVRTGGTKPPTDDAPQPAPEPTAPEAPAPEAEADTSHAEPAPDAGEVEPK